MRVLITRPRDDSETIAVLLTAAGHRPLRAPLLKTNWFEGGPLALDGVAAILATSANGIRALVRRTSRRDIPVFAVGPETAEKARAAGFVRVENADGDARALAKAVPRWLGPQAGALLHACGAESVGDLAESLTQMGFEVRRETLYAVDVLPLSADAANALLDRAVDAVLFFSPRSARIFVDAAESLPLSGVIALCISPATAAALPAGLFGEVRIAVRPNQEALLALLD